MEGKKSAKCQREKSRVSESSLVRIFPKNIFERGDKSNTLALIWHVALKDTRKALNPGEARDW